MDLSNYSFWQLMKLSTQIEAEALKRMWWIVLLLLGVYAIVMYVYSKK